ncbi:pseudouridylate synthase RPUSD4, mitochondrial isoform X3 [Lutra lutra]|uniref:pseudouridylate synthase RPUSD4, mitochondrial isoform X3 n=1 Tax=Lutra lutra TaxID=9657 RepID=UPI001FD46F18|nr:pseudouridylate synthase RPUSD4, mitochondrial isoform X3 [Lutra lutra]
MAAPSSNAPRLWVWGSRQRLGNVFSLVSKPFCSAAAASGTMSAQRLAEKLRAQKQEQKTKQPPVPTSPVQRRVQELVRFTKQLQRVHPNVLAKALNRGIVHQDKDLVVINKPYGLPVHGPSRCASPCPRRESWTSLSSRRRCRMTLSPGFRMEDGKMVRARSNRKAHTAVTQYQVLSSTLSAALVELQPITGVKHQLRVHLSFGLDCPILGDHKYSDWNKLAPQKLSLGTLKKLGLHQAKARHIPLHLHARQLILPALGSRKEELSLVCEPPRFFVRSLQRLDLQTPSQDQNGGDEAGREGAVKTAGLLGP